MSNSLQIWINIMSLEVFNGNCFDYETNQVKYNHSICVGKKVAYCMDCGKIIIEYKNKEDFKKLMNPFEEDEDGNF